MKHFRSTFIYPLLCLILLSACGEITREITINPEGNSSYSLTMDLGPMMDLAGSMTDSLGEQAGNKTKRPASVDSILKSMDDPSSIPMKMDTTISLGDQKEMAKYHLSDQEIALLEKMKVHMNVDKAKNKLLMKLIIDYKDQEERDNIIMAFGKVQEQKAIMEGDTIEENKSDKFFSSFGDYKLDAKNGVLDMLETDPPQEMGMGQEDEEEIDEATLNMMAMMMPGGITTRINLPGKIFKVEGATYKQLSETSISITETYVDIAKTQKMGGYKIYFEPREAITDPTFTEVWEPVPSKVDPGKKVGSAPSDAIVLFDGKSTAAWQHLDGSPVKWKVKKGTLTVQPGSGDIKTKEVFGDVQLHLEWRSPKEPNKEGQGKGNSGVFFQEAYEVQILNSYDSRTYSNGQAGAIYKQYPPLVNAMKKTGDWQTYDIIFHSPKFDKDGVQTTKGSMTVLHNSVLIQDHAILQGTTEYIGWPRTIVQEEGSIKLQDHSNEVSFRNIWLRKLN